MALKLVYNSKAEVPEAMVSMYVEKDGKWILDIGDMVPAGELASMRSKVDEFRTNNLSLTEKLADFDGKTILSTEDQAEFDRLKKQSQDIEDKNLIDAGKIDELLANKTEQMRADYDAKLTSLTSSLSDAKEIAAKHQGRLSKVLVESQVGRMISASKNTPVAGALDDIFARAGMVWKVNKEGELEAQNPDGSQMYGAEAKALTMDEWLVSTVKSAPYLFATNKGSDGQGNADTGANKGTDGIIRVSRSDEAAKGKYLQELATGKAIMVD